MTLPDLGYADDITLVYDGASMARFGLDIGVVFITARNVFHHPPFKRSCSALKYVYCSCHLSQFHSVVMTQVSTIKMVRCRST